MRTGKVSARGSFSQVYVGFVGGRIHLTFISTNWSANMANDTVTMISVTTTPAATVEKGKLQVTAFRRAVTDKATGKKQEIPASEKSRSIIIPEFQPDVSSKYVSIVSKALGETAKAQLAEMWEANPSIKEVAAVLFAEDNLLAYAARVAESKRLTIASITSWWNEGDGASLKKWALETHGDKGASKAIERIQSIASGCGEFTTPKICATYITYFATHCDADDEFTDRLIKKLAEKQAKLEAQLADNEATL